MTGDTASARDAFLQNVRQALGRPEGSPAPVAAEASPSQAADAVRKEVEGQADELLSRLAEAASQAGWKVAHAASAQEAARYVAELAREVEARSVVRSAHPVVDRLALETLLQGAGVNVEVVAAGDEADRDAKSRSLRRHATEADMGVTGVDYAVAETGTVALMAGKGVSRLVSLLPPVYVAVVERGQVLPGLDELFTLYRDKLLRGSPVGYMNLVTGPSRSADIENTLVTGVHGPGDVHLVLIG